MCITFPLHLLCIRFALPLFFPAMLAIWACSLETSCSIFSQRGSSPETLQHTAKERKKKVLFLSLWESPLNQWPTWARSDWLIFLSPNSPWTSFSEKQATEPNQNQTKQNRTPREPASSLVVPNIYHIGRRHAACCYSHEIRTKSMVLPKYKQEQEQTPDPALILICFTFVVLNGMFDVNQGLTFGDFHLLVAGSSKLC